MLFNIHTLQWDDELLRLFDVPASDAARGALVERGLRRDVRRRSGIGQRPDRRHRRRSAGGALRPDVPQPGHVEEHLRHRLLPAAEHRHDADARRSNQLLTTVAWQIGGRTEYALEGSVFIGGAVVQWLRDGLGLIRTAAEIEALARARARQRRRLPRAGVRRARRAALGSVRARHDRRHHARHDGRRTSRAPRSRASRFRSPICSTRWRPTPASPLTELRVDGGAAANDLLMQFQADLLGVPVVRPAVTETTALGAAYLAGLAVGFWKSADELTGQWRSIGGSSRRWPGRRRALRQRWTAAVERSKAWEPGTTTPARRPDTPRSKMHVCWISFRRSNEGTGVCDGGIGRAGGCTGDGGGTEGRRSGARISRCRRRDGKTYKLSDFKGKQAVVLAWFPKAFTQGCTIECKSLAEHGDMIKKYNVTYFMASVDPLEGEKGNKAFARGAPRRLPAAQRSDQGDGARRTACSTERGVAQPLDVLHREHGHRGYPQLRLTVALAVLPAGNLVELKTPRPWRKKQRG